MGTSTTGWVGRRERAWPRGQTSQRMTRGLSLSLTLSLSACLTHAEAEADKRIAERGGKRATARPSSITWRRRAMLPYPTKKKKGSVVELTSLVTILLHGTAQRTYNNATTLWIILHHQFPGSRVRRPVSYRPATTLTCMGRGARVQAPLRVDVFSSVSLHPNSSGFFFLVLSLLCDLLLLPAVSLFFWQRSRGPVLYVPADHLLSPYPHSPDSVLLLLGRHR